MFESGAIGYEKAQRIITSETTEDDVKFFGATAYVDKADAIEVFAYTRKTDELVNGVVPVRIPRAVILAYLENFPIEK